jgi:hypothetical protein
MAIHRADLHGSKKAHERVDELAVERFIKGECDLVDGLGIDDDVLQGLRRQALALYESGKFERCIKVVLGVVALGSVHPADPVLLARAYEKLGMHEAAAECDRHAERIMSALGIEVPSVAAGDKR